MKISRSDIRPLCLSLLAASVLSACGGGGGGGGGSSGTDSSSGGGPTPPGNPGSTQLTMSCVDGASFQCSGGSVLAVENGVALTRSGVQVYGRSTSDLASVNPDKTNATGLAPASGGVAEIRVARDSGGAVSRIAVLMSNLGLSWDGRNERPQTIETFDPTQGRNVLAANGALTSVPLPPSSDLNFYDYASKRLSATQAHYANNRYFPRENNPSRCGAAQQSNCLTTETTGPQFRAGDWRAGGRAPDTVRGVRFHGEGDIHAGDDRPGPNGEVRWLEGGTGVGVPFPGSKGYRVVDNWSFRYANLTNWFTQDTVLIAEWGGGDEHNKARRGFVAFGDVTDPARMPASGTATYNGTAYGLYAPNGVQDPVSFTGAAVVTVNFATREAVVQIQNATSDGSGTAVPVNFRATTRIGAAGSNTANYLTGPADSGSIRGGVSGRYFGPGAEEIGGAFSLSSSGTGAVGLGGFIGRRQ